MCTHMNLIFSQTVGDVSITMFPWLRRLDPFRRASSHKFGSHCVFELLEQGFYPSESQQTRGLLFVCFFRRFSVLRCNSLMCSSVSFGLFVSMFNWQFNWPIRSITRDINTTHWRYNITLTLKMTTAQAVETSVTVTNSSFQNYAHPGDHTTQTTVCLFVV